MKKILFLCLLLLCSNFNCVSASILDEMPNVAVMDFGTHMGAATADINLTNAEKISCEYVIDGLITSRKFNVVDKELIEQRINEEQLNIVGLIDPETAKRLGDLLEVKYLIYGNVVDVTSSATGTQVIAPIGGGVDVTTVKSHIIVRMMNVATGDIIMAAKGEGASKSTYVKVKSQPIGTVKVGTTTVTQDSVHNAIQKAAYAAVDLLVKRLESV